MEPSVCLVLLTVPSARLPPLVLRVTRLRPCWSMELVPMLVLLVSSVRLQVSVLLVKTLRARCAPVLVQCARNVMPLVLVLF